MKNVLGIGDRPFHSFVERPFGSRAWGGESDNSDWDYVVAARFMEDIKHEIDTNFDIFNITWHVYDENKLNNVGSVKFEYKGEVINYIFYPDSELQIIDELNHIMANISTSDKAHVLEDKEVRCAIVEAYLGAMINYTPKNLRGDELEDFLCD